MLRLVAGSAIGAKKALDDLNDTSSANIRNLKSNCD